MKSLRIKLIGFPKGWDWSRNLVFVVLRKKYNLIFVDDNPDYVFCSCFGSPYDYLKYGGVRIFMSGENFCPDFNYVDYAITSYPITFFDRHFRLPYFMWVDFDKALHISNRDFSELESIGDRPYFCNFIFSHESENELRGLFFKRLSAYKRIESCGTYLNNMQDGFTLTRDEKFEMQRKCRFTICFESTCHDGFITEKILDAFYAGTIPIYCGSKDINSIFNNKAYINVSDYQSVDDAINDIIDIDNDRDRFNSIMSVSTFIDKNYPSRLIEDLTMFLCNIFDQPLYKAKRRSEVYTPLRWEKWILSKKTPTSFIDRLKNKLRKK